MNHFPEWKLLLACSKASLTADDLRSIKQDSVCPNLDWDYLTSASYAHGIAPLIYHNLYRSGVVSMLPPAAAETLRSSYYSNAVRNLLLHNELQKVIHALRERRIDVIVLKGAALADTVYSDRALRPMSDIDLLVRKKNLTDAEAQLLDMGYTFEENTETKEYYQQHHYHWVFVKRSAPKIEIHWHIARPTSPFRIDIDGLWQRAGPFKMAGTEALVLSPEDLLLHLCQHPWKHSLTGGVRPFCDIAETARYYRDQINWRRVIALSSEWKTNPCAFLGLTLAKELFDAPIPEFVFKELKPHNFDVAIIDWARERLLSHPESSPFSADLLVLLGKGHCLKERFGALKRVVSPSALVSCDLSPEASKKKSFCYARRIMYLLQRYGLVAWQLLFGDQKARATAQREENQLRLTKWLSSI